MQATGDTRQLQILQNKWLCCVKVKERERNGFLRVACTGLPSLAFFLWEFWCFVPFGDASAILGTDWGRISSIPCPVALVLARQARFRARGRRQNILGDKDGKHRKERSVSGQEHQPETCLTKIKHESWSWFSSFRRYCVPPNPELSVSLLSVFPFAAR